MRRVLVIGVVLTVLVLGGCVDGFEVTEGSTPAEATSTGSPLGDSTTAAEPGGGGTDGELRVHYLDVGQADATLLEFPNGETMLVDSGDWRDDGAAVIDALQARNITRLDHLVTTHAHADHIGGHAAVIDYFEQEAEGVGAVYDPGVASTSKTYERYLDAIERHDVTLFEVQAGDSLSVGSASVQFVNPPADPTSDDLHDNAATFVVSYGETEFLFTGDAEAATERRLVERHDDTIDADVYQAGHHGSSTSSSSTFLDAVQPEKAVISSALDSQYGHPHDEVLQAFADRGYETYWTAVHGTITMRSDGQGVTVSTETDGPTDPLALLDRKESTPDASLASPHGLVAGPPLAG